MALVPVEAGVGGGKIWEVVCGKGVVVRVGRELSSPAVEDRLSVGSLVQECELVGDRLRYDRVAGTGNGPDSGWVSTRAGGRDLVVPSHIEPPQGGWRILHDELPRSWAGWGGPALPAAPGSAADAGRGSVARPQCSQRHGEPYVLYKRIFFGDTKPTGLRMSACFVAMDDARTDAYAVADHSVESMGKVNSPITQASVELRPGIARLGLAPDGLLYGSATSKGPVLQWLCNEAEYGWPSFPLMREAHRLYVVGKDQASQQREHIATGRFTTALVDESQSPPSLMVGPEWERDCDAFFSSLKENHASQVLNETTNLHALYPDGAAFTPTCFARVNWRMTHSFSDTWAVLYHARVPEMLWDINMIAGGAFESLLATDPDPQALTMNLPRKMQVGVMYAVFCYLEERSRRAAYLLCPIGEEHAGGCVLAVVARYDWARTPVDGRTLTSQDLKLVEAAGRKKLFSFTDGANVEAPSAVADLSQLQKPIANGSH